MNSIERELSREQKELKKIIEAVKARLKKAPRGCLFLREKRGYLECYIRDGSKDCHTKGKYVRKKEMPLARKIVQRDYDETVLRRAEMRMKAIDTFLEKYAANDVKSVYEHTHPLRKKLLDHAFLTDDEYAFQWQSETYSGKAFFREDAEIVTERGERVRSKSEKIIADKLYRLGIPYRYECPLLLDGELIIYPDFTILKKYTREVVYLEHFGRMDDPEYAEKTWRKLDTYSRNEIYPGIRLFFTYETSKKPLNTMTLDGFLRQLFLENGS
ncbi:MAG: hypothetical protein ACI4FY_01350 [Acetatifactor sp.]